MNYLFKYLNISFFCCVFLVACSGKDNLVNPNTLDNDDNISKNIQTEKKGIVYLMITVNLVKFLKVMEIKLAQ